MAKPKVLLIGWDAADWKIIYPLIAKGQMPALKRIMDKGVYGNLSTMNPPYSPMLWSTVATGKTPDKHGVLGFIEVMPNSKGIRPVTVTSRKAKAIWNILHYKGYKSNLVGWWPSFPAEPINGVVVSDRFQKVHKNPKIANPIQPDTIHPASKIKDLADLRMFPYEITEAHILPFIPKAKAINQEKDKSLNSFAKMMAQNTSIHCAATQLMRTTEWDFMAIYYDLIDHFCHAFMKYYPPKQQHIPQNLFDIYKDAVVGAYRYQDMMLERTLELVDKDTTVIVMSDHGFESGHRRLIKMPKYPAAPALEHRQFGIFVAAGPTIKEKEKIFGLGLLDIVPTLLHIYKLPIGKDMDGTVALDIFKEPQPPQYIESWESITGDFAMHQNQQNNTILEEDEAMQQLVELGYIEAPETNSSYAIVKTQCDLKHNLARVYLGKKDYAMAKQQLLELINENYPNYEEKDFKGKSAENLKKLGYKVGDSIVNTIPYYMDLLSISLKEKEYKNATTYLKKLRELDTTFKQKTYISEAKILIGTGKPQEALKVLEAAKYKKTSEVWYQIGKIYRRLLHLEKAKTAFENAIEIEPDRSKPHQALAEVLIRLGDYETAAEHALTAIELVKYFPEAHYTLGEALEKLGELEHAKRAYETAAKLQPKTHFRAETALENIQEKLNLKDKISNSYRKNQITIVSGLPRSGTSLMMQMLEKGGIIILTDNNRKADTANPKGYYEYDPVLRIHKDNSWLELAQGKAVKIVAPLLQFLSPKFRYKIIFMTRNLTEIIKSQQKMIGKNPDILPVKLIENYTKHLQQINSWKDKEPHIEMLFIDYSDTLNYTLEVVKKIEDFIGKSLQKKQMKKCIDKTLYRTKTKPI